MKSVLTGLTAATIVAGTSAVASAEPNEAVPRLDHVFVLVLENHNSFTSFGANGISTIHRRPTFRRSPGNITSRPTTTRYGIRACRTMSR